MNVLQWYVAFWPRDPGNADFWARFGHVEIFGYTKDDTWVFIDPRRHRLEISVTHIHDEVEDMIAHRFANCRQVWKTSGSELRYPTLAPYLCITVVAATLGIRAFTFKGLARKLAATGAELLHETEDPEGRPGGQEGAGAGTPTCGA